MYDARNGKKQMELSIVNNLILLAREKNLEKTPFLDKLFFSLNIIQEDGWDLKKENLNKISQIYD
jgi:hypothetical protein